MKWDFLGFREWKAGSGVLTIEQGLYVLAASFEQQLPREICEGCVCWREFGTCRLVQVSDYEGDRRDAEQSDANEIERCRENNWFNCCPILFFDFIGIPLPELNPRK